MVASNRARVAVLVSGGGTNLQAIIDKEKLGEIPHGQVVLVSSANSNAFALERAKKAGISTYIFDEEDDLIKKLKAEKIDLIVLAGFLRILSKEFINEFDGRIINVHPSLIPSFCGKGCYGLHVHEKVLEYGVKVTGATVHFVNEIPDGGQIIFQKAVYIDEDDTPETLQKKVMREAEWILLPKAIELISEKIVNNKE